MKLKIILPLMALVLSTYSCGEGCKNETKESATITDAIMSRRSIRNYKTDQIKADELNKILECGINAPSAMNRQSWEIRVIQNVDILSKIKGNFHKAPTLIVIGYQPSNSFSVVDCGMLGQNILLAAESMNIGTCVLGSLNSFYESEEGAEVVQSMQFSEGYKPLYSIAIGYKNESPDAKPRDKGKIKIIQ